MGQVWSSIKTQSPVYTATPLVCSAVLVSVALGARQWDPQEPSTLISFLHLGSLAMTVGSQVWHNLVASPPMLEILPRNTFIDLQVALFSRLFMMNSVMSSVTIATFLMRHPTWQLQDGEGLQLFALVTSFVGNALNSVCFLPMSTKADLDLRQIDKMDRETILINPAWTKAHRNFQFIHGVGLGISMLGLFGSSVYLYLLAKGSLKIF